MACGGLRGTPPYSRGGTYKTVRARFWPWISGSSPCKLLFPLRSAAARPEELLDDTPPPQDPTVGLCRGPYRGTPVHHRPYSPHNHRRSFWTANGCKGQALAAAVRHALDHQEPRRLAPGTPSHPPRHPFTWGMSVGERVGKLLGCGRRADRFEHLRRPQLADAEPSVVPT